MRETGMVIECKSRQHKFLLGLTDDGCRECPICSEEILQPREAFNANEIYGMKTIGQAWRDKRTTKKKSTLNVEVEMNTDKMQLKLRAIAKHAEALADELGAIDNSWQCDCGSLNYEDNKLYSNNEPYSTARQCTQCGELDVITEKSTMSDEQ